MDLIQAFVIDGTSYNVRIEWNGMTPLFKASDIGDVLGLVNVRTSIACFDDDEKVVHTMDTPGGPQETLFLTEMGVYRLLMLSRKPIARPFQKWVTKVLVEIREKGKYELQRRVEDLQREAEDSKVGVIRSKHEALVQAFEGHNRPVVYIAYIVPNGQPLSVMLEESPLHKIGSSVDIRDRIAKIKQEFGCDVYLSFAMEVSGAMGLELRVHKHPDVKQFRAEYQKTNKGYSNEVYRLSEMGVKKVLNIIHHNKHTYMSSELELARLHLAETERQLEITRLTHVRNEPVGSLTPFDGDDEEEAGDTGDEDDEQGVNYITVPFHERRHTQNRGPKIQAYTADGSRLVKTYPGAMEAERDETMGVVASSLRRAMKDKTVYKGYRWVALERHLPDNTFQEIGASEDQPTREIGLVAMINKDETRIVRVFKDQKAAAKDGKVCPASICQAIKYKRLSAGGHFYRMWYDCSPELKRDYLEQFELPEREAGSRSKAVLQIDPVSGRVRKHHDSVASILQKVKCGRRRLYAAIDEGLIFNGWRWKWAEETVPEGAASASTSARHTDRN